MKFDFKHAPLRTRKMETETTQKNVASPKSQTSRMNNLLQLFTYVILLGGMTLIAASCSKDNDNNAQKLSSNINTKWEIANSASKYASFEFNKDGNYIVVERVSEEYAAIKSKVNRNIKGALLQKPVIQKISTRASSESGLSPIHFGSYKIEGNKIILSGFGVIDVISITAEEFNFSFTLEATGVNETYIANKTTNAIPSSSRTDMLCRTWTLEKVTIDENVISEIEKEYYIALHGADWKTKVEKELTEELQGLVVLFSKAGTYLVLQTNDESEDAGLSEWKWANKEETAIYYSWDNWEEDWTGSIVQVKSLNNSTLIMQEDELVYHCSIVK